jgi:ubiquinone/menaquinone biosynthesis C-methylase UbiE
MVSEAAARLPCMLVTYLQSHAWSRHLIYKLGRGRAEDFVARIRPHLDPIQRIIDIGAGTCNVTEVLRQQGLQVEPYDIADLSFVDGTKATIYDGKRLPVPDKYYDVALLLTVLHHAPDPDAIVAEAARVAHRVIIIEDVYRNAVEKYLTYFFDSLFNLEFAGHPHTNKSDAGWRALFTKLNLNVTSTSSQRAMLVFRQALYVLEH